MKRPKVGYHVVYDRDLHEALEYAHRHGFDYIVPDLTVPRFWPESFNASERSRVRRSAEDLGVSIAFHAPTAGVDLSTAYPDVRRGVLERLRRCLELARDLEAMWVTIHPSQPPSFSSGGQEGSYLRDHSDLYRAALRDNITTVASEGVDIHVENDPLTPFIELALGELLERLDNLYLALDVPKALDPAKGDPERVLGFYLRHRGRVRELHLHDKRPQGHAHDTLGLGGFDLERYLSLFKGVPYYTLEVRPRESAYKSLLWLQERWRRL
jgi:sugar phosphate isomerase/epimerase